MLKPTDGVGKVEDVGDEVENLGDEIEGSYEQGRNEERYVRTDMRQVVRQHFS